MNVFWSWYFCRLHRKVTFEKYRYIEKNIVCILYVTYLVKDLEKFYKVQKHQGIFKRQT